MWRSLTFFDLDHQVTNLSWKIAHSVLYTTQCLISFGLSVPPIAFADLLWSLWSICSLSVL